MRRRFADLMEIGRARLRSLAPDWTDHNAHDPGITLMELLAWTCEAQLYSLSRISRGERAAYAAMFGLTPAGAGGARGSIWPDRQDPNAPASTFARNVVVSDEAPIRMVESDGPEFRATHELLWTPGRIVSLVTRHGGGRETDHTRLNARGGLPFAPFGTTSRRDVLALTFECRDPAGLSGTDPEPGRLTCWAIGVQSATPEPVAGDDDRGPRIEATLAFGQRRIPLRVAFDSSRGLQTSGVLLLDLANVRQSPGESTRVFTVELRPTTVPAVAPSVLRIEPNVIPIRQLRAVRDDAVAEGRPDWTYRLSETDLAFPMGGKPVTVQVAQRGGSKVWTECERLTDHGPEDEVYAFDLKRGDVRFGNGVNGRIPETGAQVTINYAVSDGSHGNVAPNRKWRVPGFPGAFGVNADPITGGTAATGLSDHRREARRLLVDQHPLVTTKDIIEAARNLPFLDVSRAWIPPPGEATPYTGAVTLIAMRHRAGGVEPEGVFETRRWLAAIRRGLSGRMLLGSRLVVMAPRYVGFAIHAVVEAQPARDPKATEAAIRRTLGQRLALTDTANGSPPRQPGVGVTVNGLKAWIRTADGAGRVLELNLVDGDGRPITEVRVPKDGLPKWDAARSEIVVNRPAAGGGR